MGGIAPKALVCQTKGLLKFFYEAEAIVIISMYMYRVIPIH